MRLTKNLGDHILETIQEYVQANYSIELNKALKCLKIHEIAGSDSNIHNMLMIFLQPEAQHVTKYHQIYLQIADYTQEPQINNAIIGYCEIDDRSYLVKDLMKDHNFLKYMFLQITESSLEEKRLSDFKERFATKLISFEKTKLGQINHIISSSPRYVSIICGKHIVKLLKTFKREGYNNTLHQLLVNLSGGSSDLTLPISAILVMNVENKEYLTSYISHYYTDAVNLGEIIKNSLRVFYSTKNLSEVEVAPQFIQTGKLIATLHDAMDKAVCEKMRIKHEISKSAFIREVGILLNRFSELKSSQMYESQNYLDIINKFVLHMKHKYEDSEETMVLANSLGNCNLYQMLKISNRILMRNIYTYESLLEIESPVYKSQNWDLANLKHSIMWYTYTVAAEFADINQSFDELGLEAKRWISKYWTLAHSEYRKNRPISMQTADDFALINIIAIIKLLDDTYVYIALNQKASQSVLQIYRKMMQHYITDLQKNK